MTDTPTQNKPYQIALLGGLGFLGSHIARQLAAADYPVRIFGRSGSSRHRLAGIADRVTFAVGDAGREDDVMNAIAGAHTVIHAIHTSVPGISMRDPVQDIITNVAASAAWLRRLNETDVRRVIYISSGGTVYGVARYNPIDEAHPTEPISSYGITKLAVEKYVAMYASLYGREHTILRPANVFGPGQKLDVGQGVIGVMIARALRGEPFELWGDGTAVRDYLYVEDMARAVLAAVRYDGAERVFNVATGEGHSVLDIISAVEAALGFKLDVVQRPYGGFHVPVSVVSGARLRAATGWSAQVPFADGIARTVAWLRDKG